MKYVFFFFISFLIYSCTKPDVCNTSTSWNGQFVFYTTSSLMADSAIGVDSIHINAVNNSVFLYTDTTLKRKSVSLPLDISTDTSRYVFGRHAFSDTLTIAHQSVPVYISKACGYGYKQTLLGVSCTNHLIKSVAIKSTSIEKDATENIKIYY